MSYVDLMGDVRWSEGQHVERVEASLRASVTHVREHVMLRRSIGFTFYLFAQMLPPGPMKDMLAGFGQPLTPAALAELTAAAQVFIHADILAAQARADSALLDATLDYEQAQATLAALPSPPSEGDDLHAELRQALVAVIEGASPEALALVAQRAAARPVSEPQVEPQEQDGQAVQS